MRSGRFRSLALALCLSFAALAYLPAAGRFLRTDDWERIEDNRTLDRQYFHDLFLGDKSERFYRPLHHLSFGITYRFFGIHALPYGLFNGLLLLGSVFLVFRLAELVTNSSAFAALTTLGWLLGIRSISWTVWWAVGRTSGMYTFFLLLSLLAMARSGSGTPVLRTVVSVFCMACAMLTKESALTGPVFLVVLLALQVRRGRCSRERLLATAAALALLYLAYFYLRARSGALGPRTAPDYYRLDFSPGALLGNLVSYLERALVFCALVVLPLFAVPRSRRRRPRVSGDVPVLAILGAGLAAFLVAIAPEIAIVTRSNLYTFFPSVFFVATLVGLLSKTRRWPARRADRKRLLVAMAVLAAFFAPVVWAKGETVVRERAHVYEWTRAIAAASVGRIPEDVVLRWEPAAFGELRPEARDFRDLELALSLSARREVALLVNPRSEPAGAPVFELVPDARGRRVGALRPAGPR